MKNHKIFIMILIITPLTSSQSASPVYELINEQARIDEKVRSPSILPYGNPLAGKQNARQHFNNQQAMFNAERIRQLTAQLQRQSRGPKLIDSYMQAYHESQDNHQLALEQQQANLKEQVIPLRHSPQKTTQRPITKRINKNDQPRPSQGAYGTKIQRPESERKRPESMRITKADAKDVKYRNHRSYGSVDYHQYLEPRRYKTVYVSPAPTYDQGVTIKPNGNIGFSQEAHHQSKLLTEAIPSDTKYVYPKQYRQMQNYQSIQELQNLNSFLSPQTSPEYALPTINSNDVPIDFYFYLKDPSHLSQNYDQFRYAQLANSYKGTYNKPVTKEYTPITEEVDDIEDPNAKKPKAYTPLPEPTVYPQVQPTAPTKEENYKIEDANPSVYTYEEKPEEKPIAQAIHYYQPYYIDDKEQNKKYLHHNAENAGVQHLAEDGTGISAYGEDNLHYAANYDFGYRVHDENTGNYFGHSEAKKGDNTNGHYHVLLPDGRMQNVKYHAGPSGFHADISYDHLN